MYVRSIQRLSIVGATIAAAVGVLIACSSTEGDVLSLGAEGAPDGTAEATDDGATGGGDGATTSNDDGGIPTTSCDVPAPWTTPATSTTVGDGTPASCTGAALQAAVSKGGLVTFSCGAGNVTINITTTIDLKNGTQTILDGAGKITLDGGGTTRILNVESGQQLSVRNLTLQNAYVIPSAADIADAGGSSFDPSAWQGGAIRAAYKAKLEILDSQFVANKALQGGAIFAGSAAEVTIVGSKFHGNTAWNEGAMKTVLSLLTIVNTVFDGNSTVNPPAGAVSDPQDYGGTGAFGTDGTNLGSYLDGGIGSGGTLSLCGAVVTNNTSPNGAGGLFLWAYAPDNIVIKQSTFANNQGGGLGGAGRVSIGPTPNSYACTPSDGGADGGANCVFTTPGSIDIETTSVLSNTSNGNAGGLYIDCLGECAIKNSTFYANNSTTGVGSAIQSMGWGPEVGGPGPGLHLDNVTFAHNGDLHGYMNIFGHGFVIHNTVFESSNPICLGTSTTGNSGSNVFELMPSGAAGIGFNSPCVDGATVVTTDPTPLAMPPSDNGGSTPTVLPASDSPLVGAGAGCEPTDQRGFARNVSKCTVGAVEVGANQ